MPSVIKSLAVVLLLLLSVDASVAHTDDLERKLRTAAYQLASDDIDMRSEAFVFIVEAAESGRQPASESATMILLALLNDQTSDYRVMSAIALLETEDKEALEHAVRVLVEDLRNGPESRKPSVIEWLRKAGTTEALDAIGEHEKPWWKLW